MSASVVQLAEWVVVNEVSTGVIKSTGVFWRPVYYTLEGRVPELSLVNAMHVKRVPRRKTDASDAERLADVGARGMVRPSYVPPPPIGELRELTRYRKTQIDARTREVQRLEKVLQDTGIKLSSVASGTWSQSAQAMVEAMISDEHDPTVLAEMAKSRMRSKMDALTLALDGNFRDHHRVVARRTTDHILFLDHAITAYSQSNEIEDRFTTFEAAAVLLGGIPGWGRATIEVFIAETGGDMTIFPSPAQLASWAGVAPGTHESAGKRRPTGAMSGNVWLGRALLEAARAGARTKNTYVGAQYRRLAARRGPNRAAVAVAHSMLVAAWHMLTTGETYRELGADYFARRQSPVVRARKLTRQLEELATTSPSNRRLNPSPVSGGSSLQGVSSVGDSVTGRSRCQTSAGSRRAPPGS